MFYFILVLKSFTGWFPSKYLMPVYVPLHGYFFLLQLGTLRSPQTPWRRCWWCAAPLRASQTASLSAARDRLQPKSEHFSVRLALWLWTVYNKTLLRVCVTCGQQHGCRWSRYDFRWCSVIWVEICGLETVSVTQTHQNSVRHTGEIDPGRYRPIVCVCVCLYLQ